MVKQAWAVAEWWLGPITPNQCEENPTHITYSKIMIGLIGLQHKVKSMAIHGIWKAYWQNLINSIGNRSLSIKFKYHDTYPIMHFTRLHVQYCSSNIPYKGNCHKSTNHSNKDCYSQRYTQTNHRWPVVIDNDISTGAHVVRTRISTAAGEFIRFKVQACNPFDADISSNLPVTSWLHDCLYQTISTRIVKRNSFILNTGTIKTINWPETIVTEGGGEGGERERELVNSILSTWDEIAISYGNSSNLTTLTIHNHRCCTRTEKQRLDGRNLFQ